MITPIRCLISVLFFIVHLGAVEAEQAGSRTKCEPNGVSNDGAPLQIAKRLNDLGMICFEEKSFVAAETAFRRSLEIYQAAGSPDRVYFAEIVHNLGSVYLTLRSDESARTLLRYALAIRQELLGPNSTETLITTNALGILAYNLGDYEMAAEFQLRAVEGLTKTLGENSIYVAIALDNFGNTLSRRGAFDDAEHAHRHALKIFERVSGDKSAEYFTALNNLAQTLQAANRFSEAEGLLRSAFAGRQRLFGSEHPETAKVLINLCDVLLSRLANNDSETCYRRALKIMAAHAGLDNVKSGEAMRGIARSLAQKGNLKGAIPFFKSANQAGSMDKVGFLAALRSANPENVALSFEVFQAAQISVVGNALSNLKARLAAQSGPLSDLIRREQDLTAAQQFLGNEALLGLSKNRVENSDFEAKLRQTEKELYIAREEISSKFPQYTALLGAQPISFMEIQSLLEDDEAVVAIEVGETASYAWVVTRSQATWKPIPARAQSLLTQIELLRASLTLRETLPYDASLAYEIYKTTFGPIEGELIGKKRISVVSTGALTSLPLGILVASNPVGKRLQQVDWLLKRHAITVLPSIESLRTLRKFVRNAQRPLRMIAFADPIFSKTSRERAQQNLLLPSITNFFRGLNVDVKSLAEQLSQLSETRREVDTIAKSLSPANSEVRTGFDATERAVKNTKLDQYSIVYFATHGLVAGDLQRFAEIKAEPALVLTIPDRPSEIDDGLLQASEVAQLRLDADWVVLSACNTASGAGPGAEPLSGLASAFFYAGGRSLLVSHWDVADSATATLMSTLFKLAKKRANFSHAELLREASLKMLALATDERTAHPRLWAAFVVVGEPRRKP